MQRTGTLECVNTAGGAKDWFNYSAGGSKISIYFRRCSSEYRGTCPQGNELDTHA